MRSDFLPGDGTIDAIREEHRENLARKTDPNAVAPNPYMMARVALLLREIDRLTAATAELSLPTPFPPAGSELASQKTPQHLSGYRYRRGTEFKRNSDPRRREIDGIRKPRRRFVFAPAIGILGRSFRGYHSCRRGLG